VGAGHVVLPGALHRKLLNASQEWLWQWVFPATRFAVLTEGGLRGRHHLHESVIQRAVRQAVLVMGLTKGASCHTFRHSFATPSARRRLRHPHGSGASRSSGRQHDADRFLGVTVSQSGP
jgi:integrase